MENSTQKVSKISVSSSEYPSDCSSDEDSMEYERTPQHSLPPQAIAYKDLIKILSLTLSQREIPHDSNDLSFSNLKALTSTLCTEFLKLTHPAPSPSSEASETVLNKLLTNQFSVTLDSAECKMVLALMVNLLRESTETRINSKVQELQISVINSAKTIKRLKEEIEEKNSVIEAMQAGKTLQIGKVKKSKYMESESTLNESQDLFI